VSFCIDCATIDYLQRKPRFQESAPQDKNMDKQDLLSVFLNSVLDNARKNMTKELAKQVVETCLRSYKERLQQKERLLLARLEKESKALKKRQAMLSKNQADMETEEEQEHQRFIAEAGFRKRILEQRLSRVCCYFMIVTV